jgi:type IV pilus assembly protein PilC
MLTFKYKARDTKSNELLNGEISANTQKEAIHNLVAQGLSIVNMREDKGGLFSSADKVSTKVKIVFTRQLATLINAGLPIAQAMTTVEEQTQDKTMKRIVQIVRSDVEGGRKLSDAFARWPKVFNNLYISITAAGEMAGTLEKSLVRLADQQDKDAAIMKKVKGAFIYPIIVLVVMVGVIAYLLSSLVPQVKQLYGDLGQELPIVTQIVVAVVDFFTANWYIVALIVAILVFFWWRYIKTDKGRITMDTIKLNVPLFKGLFTKLYMARFCRTMEILLASGVHMIESMEISSRSINNVVLEKEIVHDSDYVKGGKPLSEALKRQPGDGYVLAFVPQMVSIGEKSGKIDEMLGKTASYYEDEVDEAVKTIQTLIEPFMMIMLAGMAALVIIAILMPIYQLSSTISM